MLLQLDVYINSYSRIDSFTENILSMIQGRNYYYCNEGTVPSVNASVTAVKEPIKGQGVEQQAGQQSRSNFAVDQSDAKFENRNYKY